MRTAIVIGLLVAGRAHADTCEPVKSTSPDGKHTAVVESMKGGAKLTVDGRSVVLASFPVCPRGSGVRWSADSLRVLVGLDTGHGLRLALFDGGLVVDAFARVDALESPELRHVAWVHYSEDWPEAAKKQTLHVDSNTVRTGGVMSRLAWTSDTELAFCDGGDRYLATIGASLAVKRTGACTD